MFPFGKKKGEVIPSVRLIPPDVVPPPTLKEEMLELYKKNMRLDDAFRTLKARYPKMTMMQFQLEWADMKKEARSGLFF